MCVCVKSCCPETHIHLNDCSIWTSKVVGIGNEADDDNYIVYYIRASKCREIAVFGLDIFRNFSTLKLSYSDVV